MIDIAFNKNCYCDEKSMMEDVGSTMLSLVRNGYECSFVKDDAEYYVLSADFADREIAERKLMWVKTSELTKDFRYDGE